MLTLQDHTNEILQVFILLIDEGEKNEVRRNHRHR